MGNWAKKGNAFERETGRTLSRWVTGGEDATQLIRSVQSGGWAGRRDGDGLQAGDLAANGPAGDRFREHFAVECKHRKEIDLWHLWSAAPGDNIAGWWTKLWAECRGITPVPCPLLIFKLNFRPTLAGLPSALLTDMAADVMTFHWEGVLTVDGETLLPPPLGLLRLDDFLEDDPENWYDDVREWSRAWTR